MRLAPLTFALLTALSWTSLVGCAGCFGQTSSAETSTTTSAGLVSPTTSAHPSARALLTPELPKEFMRGMTLSCPTWGPIWGEPETARAMDDVKTLGVTWVAIHPYASVRKDGDVRFTPADQTSFLNRAQEMARTRGLKLLWKPHLAYWGQFKWRGSIAFDDDNRSLSEKRWRKFFTGYRAFIVDQAKLAQQVGAQMFVVGLEYEATVHREKEWRDVIAAVRAVYHGPITYAANWDGMYKVKFWDALDVIGVQAYFPVANHNAPLEHELDAQWEKNLAALRVLSSQYGKRILFAEIGYAAHKEAPTSPWKPGVDDIARPMRAKLIRKALEKMESDDIIMGAFWWKWMPGNPSRHDADFSMRDPEARAALSGAWSPAAVIR